MPGGSKGNAGACGSRRQIVGLPIVPVGLGQRFWRRQHEVFWSGKIRSAHRSRCVARAVRILPALCCFRFRRAQTKRPGTTVARIASAPAPEPGGSDTALLRWSATIRLIRHFDTTAPMMNKTITTPIHSAVPNIRAFPWGRKRKIQGDHNTPVGHSTLVRD